VPYQAYKVSLSYRPGCHNQAGQSYIRGKAGALYSILPARAHTMAAPFYETGRVPEIRG